MKTSISKAAQWTVRLLLAVCLMAVMSGGATAWDLSATSITVPSGKHGRMYFTIVDQYNNTVAGGSLPEGAASGVIRGVPSGAFTLNAFVDTTGTGYQHANDPAFSTPIFVSGNSGGPAVFTTPAPVATAAPDPAQGNFDVMPLDGAAFVGFTPDGSDNLPTADRHTIYWSTDINPGPGQTTGGGSLVITSKDPKVVIYNLVNGTPYYFSVRAENSVNTPLSTVVGPIFPAAQPVSPSTVNVPVDTTGISKSSSTPLIVIVTDNNNAFYFGHIMTPADVQTVPVTGVQAGTYLIYTILDLSGTGNLDDPRNASNMNGVDRNQRPLPIVVDGISATITAPTTKLAVKKAGLSVSTNHSRQNGFEYFGLSFDVAPMSNNQLVNVTLERGPQISGPIDMGIDSNNDGIGAYSLFLQVPNRPAVGDTYEFSLYYADDPLTAEDRTAKVTAVLDNFPFNNFPVGATGPDSVSPTFSWVNPGNLPGFVFTSISLNNNGIDFLPMNVLTATPPEGTSFPVGQVYQWNRSVEDLDGNQAQQSISFTPNASGPVISDFTPKSGADGTSVTITGSGFHPVFADYNNSTNPNKVKFNGAQATVTAASATSLTVTAPASSGVITVTVGSGTTDNCPSCVTAGSSEAFNATTVFTGATQDNASPANNLSGVAIALAENPTVSIGTSGSAATGSPNYSVQVPARPYFSLLFSKSSYYPTYTALMSTTPTGTNFGSWSMFNAQNLTDRAVLPASGKGVIIGRVQDWTNNTATNLGGAVVTATSLIHPDVPYVVKYTNNSTNVAQDPASFTSTATSGPGLGQYYVVDVDEGDYVTVTASKTGISFQTRVFNTHGDAVSNHSVRGATPGTPSASPIGGAYATAQSVTLSTTTPTTDDILYTTNGNDPTIFGSTYTEPIQISADTTLKFATKNKYVGVAFSPVQTEVYSIGASISGQVTDANTASPLQFVNVQLYDQNGSFLNSTSSDFSGNYRFSGLSANTYKVCFYTGQGYISQCWQNSVANPAAATPIVVGTSPVPGISAALQIGAIIAGTVTNSGSGGIQNVWVNVYDTNGNQIPGIGGANTDANGDYALGGLPTGTYKLYFNGMSTGYIGQWYSNKADAASADTVPVTAGGIYPGYNAQLALGGAISGRVTNNSAAAVPGVNVQLRDTGGNFINGINSATTQPDGTYTISGIPPGSYKLYFDGNSTGYMSEWFDNAADQSTATTLVVSAGGSLTGRDAVLASGGTISGKVTSDGTNGIQNVNVQVRDSNGNMIPNINGTITDVGGNYTLGGLPSGSYKLFFDGSSSGYISEWFNNVADQSLASTIVVNAGFTYPGYNAQLAQGATISGRVTSDGTTGIQGISAQLQDSTGNFQLSNVSTDLTGAYQFRGLPSGSYRVCFSSCQPNYAPQCYNSLPYMPQSATLIPVTAPGVVNNSITTLAPGGGISGQVSTGSSGIQNVFIEVRDTATGNPIPGICSGWTDAGGNYAVHGIPVGGAKVYFNADSTIYGSQWYSSKPSFATSDTVSMIGGVTTPLNTAILSVATVPGAPTITSITPGSGQAQVYFNAPASDGGRQIRDYTVTFNPSGSGSGISSPINVPGLTNGQVYTVSLTARNDIGNSAAATTSYALPYFVPPGNDLQSIVDAVAANGAVWTQSGTAQLSNLALLFTKGITISGGYNFDYSTVNGYTIIPATTTGLRPGGIIIKSGALPFKVVLKNVKVKAP